MKVLVSGYGNIAKRHINNLTLLADITHLVVVRRSAAQLDQQYSFPVTVYSALDEALSAHTFDIAFVCSPAPQHAPQALRLFELGIPCFLEKPLCQTQQQAQALLAQHKHHPVPVMLGYDLRFTQGYAQLKSLLQQLNLGTIWRISAGVGQYLPDWRPGKPYQSCVSARKSLGGGVLRELSHELDYLIGLFGIKLNKVGVLKTVHPSLEMDCENEAQILAMATIDSQQEQVSTHVSLDMLSRKAFRTLKVSGTEGELVWDAIAQTLLIHNGVEERIVEVFEEGNQPYIRMMQVFLDKIAHWQCDDAELRQGIAVQSLIEQIEQEDVQIHG
ncbi:Gfo/Idh/MocA family protein [Pseudoalteromonas rubra]|uniref:Gfo/Idh/MocA family protein n=1 Tax=Pseudoalteromonas rubra TaxID=43658 RepID=UPI0013DE421C|nr:Gfo/Idh/MocA family oxidoreductase [Pseudoalteromonas rubra]